MNNKTYAAEELVGMEFLSDGHQYYFFKVEDETLWFRREGTALVYCSESFEVNANFKSGTWTLIEDQSVNDDLQQQILEVASEAWKMAANAYRIYPDQKHAFASVRTSILEKCTVISELVNQLLQAKDEQIAALQAQVDKQRAGDVAYGVVDVKKELPKTETGYFVITNGELGEQQESSFWDKKDGWSCEPYSSVTKWLRPITIPATTDQVPLADYKEVCEALENIPSETSFQKILAEVKIPGFVTCLQVEGNLVKLMFHPDDAEKNRPAYYAKQVKIGETFEMTCEDMVWKMLTRGLNNLVGQQVAALLKAESDPELAVVFEEDIIAVGKIPAFLRETIKGLPRDTEIEMNLLMPNGKLNYQTHETLGRRQFRRYFQR